MAAPLPMDDQGLLALMAALERGLGGDSPYPGLSQLSPARVASARCVVLLVIDGLGEARLAAEVPGLMAHRLCSLSSVFPSATAPAVTTFLTGAPPARHGVMGWHFEVAERDQIVTFLPFVARDGKALGGDPRDLLGASPLCERLARAGELDCVVVSPADISESAVSRAFGGPSARVPCSDLAGLVRGIESAVEGAGTRRFVYGYWSWLDSLSHGLGCEAQRTRAHLREVGDAIEMLAERLLRHDALLLVTADHGFIDRDQVIDLADHPELRACLRRPLCGEPRVAFCHVHERDRERFAGLVAERLGDAVELLCPERLLADGVFGPGPADPRARARLGDHVLRCRGRGVIVDRMPSEKPFRQIGVHGGTHPDELRVPLLAFG